MINSFETIYPWLADSGLVILLLIVGAIIVQKGIGTAVERVVRKAIVPGKFSSPAEEKKREDTIIRIFNGTLNILIWILLVLMILQQLGVEIAALIAALGVAGLAFGFGAQYLIRDLISGLFIIMENQYRVGDVVGFDKTFGLVEDITLRMTTLRDLDGTVHHIPHGSITRVSNLSKEFSRVNLDVGISYDSDLEKVIEVVNQVGNDLASDAEWADKIIKPPQFLRVSDFADSAVMIKILGDTKPLKQWEVAGELRKRLKIAFDKAKIEIPFPQRVIHSAKK
jgi:moderate conductance mechanosensitive channel